MTLLKKTDILPLERERRVTILAGPYGSGKTEIAINRAYAAGRAGRAAIVDLDIVNPYFRSRELREEFERKGIQVAAPRGHLAQADLPALTGDMERLLADPEVRIVVDVGGDPAGARLLGSYAPSLEKAGYALFLVVNPNRPFVSTPEEIETALKEIEGASKLRATAVLSNPHLIQLTTPQVVEEGHQVVLAGAARLGLPLAGLFFVPEFLGSWVPDCGDVPAVPMDRFMLPPWFEDIRRFAPYRDRRSLMEGAPPEDKGE